MMVPPVTPWNGMSLIVNETVPPHGYVITDARGNILSGGNIKTGQQWVNRRGEPAYIYGTEPVVRELLMSPDKPTAEAIH